MGNDRTGRSGPKATSRDALETSIPTTEAESSTLEFLSCDAGVPGEGKRPRRLFGRIQRMPTGIELWHGRRDQTRNDHAIDRFRVFFLTLQCEGPKKRLGSSTHPMRVKHVWGKHTSTSHESRARLQRARHSLGLSGGVASRRLGAPPPVY